MKQCIDCEEFKPYSEYYYQKKKSKKRGEYVYYPPYCKICAIKRSRNWQLDNHEDYLEYVRKHHKYNRKYNKKMIEYDRKHAREQKESGYTKEYYNRNKEYFSNYNKERNLKKAHEISNTEWTACKHYFDNSCAYCGIHEDNHYIIYGGKPKKTDLHKEHVDDNGSNKLDNCVPSCRDCNSSKWAFKLEEWYNEENENYKEERLNKILQWLEKDHIEYMVAQSDKRKVL